MTERRSLSRRRFLRGAGTVLALPLLDAMRPAFARAEAPAVKPRRMLAVCNNLGLLPDQFFPTQAGRDYVLLYGSRSAESTKKLAESLTSQLSDLKEAG